LIPSRKREGRVDTLLLQDIRRALVSGEQVRAVPGGNKRLQRLHPREQPNEIILAPEREHRIDQIMANTRFALLDFEAVDGKFD
jgi:hypothetical protein